MFQLILGFNSTQQECVLCLECSSLSNHPIDLSLGSLTRRVANRRLRLSTSFLITRRHSHDTIGINVKRNFYLRYTTACALQSRNAELTQLVVGISAGAFALVHTNVHRRLPILFGCVYLGLANRDGSVALDQRRHYASRQLDTQRQRCNIHQQHRAGGRRAYTRQDRTLYSSTVGYGLIRVDGAAQFLAVKVFRQHFLDFGDTG
mmetsp:Transcript_14872/g.29632  ORF Transcript_14872/g.29632 Transcript_14872/m.29632 type:complete len:205 (+) Transcript_14872:203-817(+)